MLNNLKALLGVLIVIGGIAYYVTMADSAQSDQAPYLIPDWHNNPSAIEEISQVQLSKGGEVIAINKVGGLWSIKDGFFANTTPLFELFQSLQMTEIVEKKTANPENHEQLELSESDLLVSFYSGDSKVSGFFVGKKTHSGLIFVRKENDNQTYTVKGLKPIQFNQDSWQLKTVLDHPASDVLAVKFDSVDGGVFEIKQNLENLSFSLLDMPEGHQLKADVQLNSLAAGLTQLMIEAAVPVSLDGLELQSINHYQLKDGTEVELQIFQKDDAFYLTIAGDKYKHFAPWMMKIAAYKFNALNKKIDDIIEPITPEEMQADDAGK